MRHVAIVGSGPAGYYTAEALQKSADVSIDIIDRLPVPYGLIRTGVAPDHQSIKAVSRRYEAVALRDNVRFIGHVCVGQDISVAELCDFYDAVVLATGAPHDRRLGIAGADLRGVIGSAAFVGWYNGHPDQLDCNPPLDEAGVAIIGNGNVALDVARILAKTPQEFAKSDIVAHARDALAKSRVRRIHIIGRRGPHQIAMTPKELGELDRLERATPCVDPVDLPKEEEDALLEPGKRKSVAHLRRFAAKRAAENKIRDIKIDFDFFAMPVAIEGEEKVERIIVEKTRLDAELRPQPTGERYALGVGLVIACIGYRTPPIGGVPYDQKRGRFANEEGRIFPGLYCVGWARRGPSGTIGTNKPDGVRIAEMLFEDIGLGANKAGRKGLDAHLAARGVEPVTFRDWQQIDEAEIAAACGSAPREKYVSIKALLGALGR